MAKAKGFRSRKEWAGIVEKWKLSGLSVKEFCKKEGVGESRFYDARREIETNASNYSKQRRQENGKELSEPLFLPIKVQTNEITASATLSNHHSIHLMELTLSNGYSLRFPSSANTQTLVKIVNALTSMTC